MQDPGDRELIREIEGRFGFLLAIATFLGAAFSGFFRIYSPASDSGEKAGLLVAVAAAVYVFSYFILQAVKRGTPHRNWLRFWHGLLFWSIGSTVFPILFFATADGNAPVDSLMKRVNVWSSFASLWAFGIIAGLLMLTTWLACVNEGLKLGERIAPRVRARLGRILRSRHGGPPVA